MEVSKSLILYIVMLVTLFVMVVSKEGNGAVHRSAMEFTSPAAR